MRKTVDSSFDKIKEHTQIITKAEEDEEDEPKEEEAPAEGEDADQPPADPPAEGEEEKKEEVDPNKDKFIPHLIFINKSDLKTQSELYEIIQY